MSTHELCFVDTDTDTAGVFNHVRTATTRLSLYKSSWSSQSSDQGQTLCGQQRGTNTGLYHEGASKFSTPSTTQNSCFYFVPSNCRRWDARRSPPVRDAQNSNERNLLLHSLLFQLKRLHQLKSWLVVELPRTSPRKSRIFGEFWSKLVLVVRDCLGCALVVHNKISSASCRSMNRRFCLRNLILCHWFPVFSESLHKRFCKSLFQIAHFMWSWWALMHSTFLAARCSLFVFCWQVIQRSVIGFEITT